MGIDTTRLRTEVLKKIKALESRITEQGNEIRALKENAPAGFIVRVEPPYTAGAYRVVVWAGDVHLQYKSRYEDKDDALKRADLVREKLRQLFPRSSVK